MYELNQNELDEVKNAIVDFNRDTANLMVDYHIAKQFYHVSDCNLPVSMALLDTFFQTQLHRAGGVPGIIYSVYDALQQHGWENILNGLGNLPDIYTNPQENDRVALLNLIPNVGDRKIWPYSFATKFFHWCKPNHFPIMDRKARKGIHDFQIRKGINDGQILIDENRDNINGKEESIEEYKKWIRFYYTFFDDNRNNAVIPNILEQIRQHDNDTQGNSPFNIENTLLRILDKYFYITGG